VKKYCKKKFYGQKNNSHVCILLLLCFTQEAWVAECPVKRDYVNLNLSQNISYVRYHPQNQFILYTDSMSSKVIPLEKMNGRIVAKNPIKTNFAAEPYPVEFIENGKPTWKYIATSSGHYYNFSQFIAASNKDSLKPEFSDLEHKEMYHSCGVLQNSPLKFRTMIWTDLKIRDYTVNTNSEGSLTIEKSAVSPICQRIYKIDQNNNKTLLPQNEINPKNPIISRDAKFISVRLPNPNEPYKSSQPNQILEIQPNGDCLLIGDLGYSANKPQFSYSKEGEKPKIVARIESGFAGRFKSGIVYVDFNTNPKTKIRLDTDNDGLVSDPGFTSDGKVIYMRKAFSPDSKAELVILDEKEIVECAKKQEPSGADKSSAVK